MRNAIIAILSLPMWLTLMPIFGLFYALARLFSGGKTAYEAFA